MLAQDRHEDSANTEGSASKRQSRRPTKFMFIDSSNGGINAKPDRVVRSFVMKSARNRKSWSTRPKSPKEGDAVDTGPQKQLPCQTTTPEEFCLATTLGPLQDHRKDSVLDIYVSTSSTSSRSGSVCSSYSNNYTWDSPLSGHTRLSAEYSHAEHTRNILLGQQAAVAQRNGFDISFRGPLNCLSVPLNAHMQLLLNQFVEGLAPRLIPVDIHGTSLAAAVAWMTRCIQSPIGAPFIFAALTASARATGRDCKVYKWSAITEVNKLLSDPRTSTDDTTIASVLILLNLEQSDLASPGQLDSDREQSLSMNRAHLSGLSTMIWQRGGLAALQTNRCLQVFILMHSIAQCITTFKRPYAIPLDSVGQIEDYGTAHFARSQATLATPLQRACSDPMLLHIFRSFNLFISDLASWYDTGSTPHLLDSVDLQKHGCLLMYRLFDWYTKDEASELAGRLASGPADQSICLAHLLFLVIATEPHTESFGPRLSTIVYKLRRSLRRGNTSHWSKVPDALLWVLTMGALAARGLSRSERNKSSDFSFFAQYTQLSFTLTTDYSGFMTTHSLLQRVYRCPWISSVFDAKAKQIWAQMGLCTPEVVDMYELSSEEEGPIVDEHAVGQSTNARFFPASRLGSKKSSP